MTNIIMNQNHTNINLDSMRLGESPLSNPAPVVTSGWPLAAAQGDSSAVCNENHGVARWQSSGKCCNHRRR